MLFLDYYFNYFIDHICNVCFNYVLFYALFTSLIIYLLLSIVTIWKIDSIKYLFLTKLYSYHFILVERSSYFEVFDVKNCIAAVFISSICINVPILLLFPQLSQTSPLIHSDWCSQPGGCAWCDRHYSPYHLVSACCPGGRDLCVLWPNHRYRQENNRAFLHGYPVPSGWAVPWHRVWGLSHGPQGRDDQLSDIWDLHNRYKLSRNHFRT